jgi:hypothetical protein
MWSAEMGGGMEYRYWGEARYTSGKGVVGGFIFPSSESAEASVV